jgi:hypothetical protein
VDQIPAYSPEARGRSERMFATPQDRLIKELAKAASPRSPPPMRESRDIYVPADNARLAGPAELAKETAFVAADAALLAETLCTEEERLVARDNTVAFDGWLQLPASNAPAHYVKVTVRKYPDGSLAVFHGPRRIRAGRAQSRSRKSGQDDKWSFCLTASESGDTNRATPPEPHTGLQGEGGDSRHQDAMVRQRGADIRRCIDQLDGAPS